MGAYNLGNVGDISSLNDFPKIQSYLYRLNEQLRYMFDNLSPEDNYNDKALLQYVADGERQSAIEVSLDQISLSMVDKDNVVAAINMSKEQIQIQADKIKMEGLVTVNSYFKIGLDGSIEARNGKFSGHISASTMDSSQITLGGNGKDGKVIVRDSQDAIIGQWDKNGIDVKLGTVSGTTINVGGSGTPGSINIYNASGTNIGSWTKTGIDVKQGAITGTAITLGGTGTAGTLTVKNALGNTIGTWTSTGIDVKQGDITGTSVTLGGSGTAGLLTVKNGSNRVIGTWGVNGMSVARGSEVGFFADGDEIYLGDFMVADLYGRQILESTDEATGMSGEPNHSGGYYLWAGWRSSSNFVFAVENTDTVVINGSLLLNGVHVENFHQMFVETEKWIVGLENRVKALEDIVGGGE